MANLKSLISDTFTQEDLNELIQAAEDMLVTHKGRRLGAHQWMDLLPEVIVRKLLSRGYQLGGRGGGAPLPAISQILAAVFVQLERDGKCKIDREAFDTSGVKFTSRWANTLLSPTEDRLALYSAV